MGLVDGHAIRSEFTQLPRKLATCVPAPWKSVVADLGRAPQEVKFSHGIRGVRMSHIPTQPVEYANFVALFPPFEGQIVNDDLCPSCRG